MERYLRYLYSDIESSIEQSLVPTDWPDLFEDDGEDDLNTGYTKTLLLPDILGIPAAAFPPDHLLTDEQLAVLMPLLTRLWHTWLLWWEMPLVLPLRKQYAAMLREMESGEPIVWHPHTGGLVKICDYEADKPCPFGGGLCECTLLDASAQYDLAIWEEHVRSQGIDPYRELSPEEEAAFDEEMQARNLRKCLGDDWDDFDFNSSLEEETLEIGLDNKGFQPDNEDGLDWFTTCEEDEDADEPSDQNDRLDWEDFDLPY